jgi:hypothetical protein
MQDVGFFLKKEGLYNSTGTGLSNRFTAFIVPVTTISDKVASIGFNNFILSVCAKQVLLMKSNKKLNPSRKKRAKIDVLEVKLYMLDLSNKINLTNTLIFILWHLIQKRII